MERARVVRTTEEEEKKDGSCFENEVWEESISGSQRECHKPPASKPYTSLPSQSSDQAYKERTFGSNTELPA